MKFSFALLVCMFISSFCVAQMAVVSCDRMNVAIMGIDNPLSIVVENVPSKSLVVKAGNGMVIKVADGHYVYKGSKLGVDEILIYKRNNGKLKEVRKIPLLVKPLPDPVASLGGPNGSIRRKLSFPQGGLVARYEDTDFEAPVRIDGYTVCIIRNDSCQFKMLANSGNRFNEEVVKSFADLHINDRVIFKDIKVILPDGTKREILPLFFIISE